MNGESKKNNGSMDDTLEDTFPASDPPSWSSPRQHEEKQLKREKDETKARPESVTPAYTKKDYKPEHGATGSHH
jgi:hypothetical protein